MLLVAYLLISAHRSVQGFGVTARSTVDTRKLDPTAIIVFHQAWVLYPYLEYLLLTFFSLSDVSEYLRDEVRSCPLIP